MLPELPSQMSLKIYDLLESKRLLFGPEGRCSFVYARDRSFSRVVWCLGTTSTLLVDVIVWLGKNEEKKCSITFEVLNWQIKCMWAYMYL